MDYEKEGLDAKGNMNVPATGAPFRCSPDAFSELNSEL